MQLQMSWVLGSVLVYTKNGWISASLAKSADFSDVMHAAKSTRLAGTVQLLCVAAWTQKAAASIIGKLNCT